MTDYLVRRIILAIPTLLIVSFLVFGFIRFLPGDPAEARLGEGYTEEAAERIREDLGLNDPWYEQYVSWMSGVLQGDLGESFSGSSQKVTDAIQDRVETTLLLATYALLLSIAIGVPIGVFAALYQDRWPDLILRSMSILALAVPGFIVATLTLAYPSIVGGWTPELGRYQHIYDDPLGNIETLFMPALILSFVSGAQIMRMTRSMMLEVTRQDYIRTARSKGLTGRVVVTRHALPNALIPVLTIAGIALAQLIGGTVIFESLYGLPGLGKYLLDSVQSRDYPAIQGIALVYGTFVVLINLLVDIGYTVLDPRIR